MIQASHAAQILQPAAALLAPTVTAIARTIDLLLAWLKWPVAIASALFLPGLVYALLLVVRAIGGSAEACVPFLAGAAGYTLLWWALLRRRQGTGFLATLEHELTHALVAWATFHRVTGFRVTLRSGGHIRYVGRGNWLIAVAPYFIPTLSLAVIAVLTLLPRQHLVAGGVVLGVTIAHHAFSTWSQTHRHQTDLQEAGALFSILFLGAANALVFGLLLAYAGGLRSLTAHLHHVRGPTLVLFDWLAARLS
jgi:peptidase M50B-like protein